MGCVCINGTDGGHLGTGIGEVVCVISTDCEVMNMINKLVVTSLCHGGEGLCWSCSASIFQEFWLIDEFVNYVQSLPYLMKLFSYL